MIAAPFLHAGFGAPLGAETLTAITAAGFSGVRLDLQGQEADGRPLLDGLPLHTTHALAQEAIDAGLQPLCIIRRAEQLVSLPDGALVELGNEIDLDRNRWSAVSYCTAADACIAEALARNRRLYLGCVSNLHTRGFEWLSSLPWASIPATIGCAVHRYPETSGPHTPHRPFTSREQEVARLYNLISVRPLAITEVGYNTLDFTEVEQADGLTVERRFWSTHGAEIVCAFQINDGSTDSTKHDDHYGLRRADGRWKPSVSAFLNAV